MVSVSTLSAETISDIASVLNANGSSLTGRGLEAVTALIEVLEAGLLGQLGDGQYYLSAMDPGMGKTLAVSRFLKVWRSRGYQPSSSVIIAISRRQEIEGYLTSSGLRRDEIAVLTSDPSCNELGVPQELHGQVRVLFTTQQMIESRTRNRPFAGVVEFFYNGEPRPLRIWDESMEPADPVVLKVDELGLIAPSLSYQQRQQHALFVDAVSDLQYQLRRTMSGEPVQVPDDLDTADLKIANGKPGASTLRTLKALSGQQALLVGEHAKGLALVGSSSTLPSDFAPVVIVDASGRVRETYRLWETHRGNLHRLPAAKNDYGNLTIYLWQRASGHDALQNPGDRSAIVNAIVPEIRDAGGEWLIVHYKDATEAFAELEGAVRDREDIKLHSLTWGMHHGTNQFSHVANVVVIGQLWRSDHHYPALASAASGLPAAEVAKLNIDDLRWGEFQHDLLQALCRASVRRSVDGRASKCRAFVIATPSAQTFSRVDDTFPGCNIWNWKPGGQTLNGQVGKAAAYLKCRFDDLTVERVSKKEVRKHLGMAASNFSKDVIKHPGFVEFLGMSNIWQFGQCFEKHRVHFEPVPGGFVWHDHDEQKEG